MAGGFFKSIKAGMDSAKEKKDLIQESKVVYKGMTMQSIGKIPENVEVELRLRPEDEILVIKWMKKEVTLPYDRIIDFRFSAEVEDATGERAKSAKNYLKNSNLAGKALSSIIPSSSKITIRSALEYYDKQGTRQELDFFTTDKTEHYDLDDLADILDGVDRNDSYNALGEQKFQEALRKAVSRTSDTEIDEL